MRQNLSRASQAGSFTSPVSAPLLVEAWKLRHNLIVHDALYVALARQLDATLITGDKRLARAPALKIRTRTVT